MTPVSVEEILKSKGSDVWSVTPDENAFKALEIMAEKNVGALVVVQDDKVTGIFSERDYARKVILLGKSSKEMPVSEIMTKELINVSPEMTTEDCMACMTDKRVRHLPVMDNGKLVGIVSIGDVVRAIIVEQDAEIKQLKDYISGSG